VRRSATAILAVAIGASAHGADECAAALDTAEPLSAQADGARVLFVPRPAVVPVGRHFQIHFVVCLGDAVRSDARVQVDADMPAHRHGMNYRAAVSTLAGGVQRAEGLMFHMPGTWRVIFDVALDGRTLRATRELEVR
jgi:YtkA-like